MFIPISDANPLRHLPFQYVTIVLIAANVAVHFLFVSGVFVDALEVGAVSYGMIPAVLHDLEQLPAEYVAVPGSVTLVTYQFLHADWLHLLSNMAFLWVFGDNVEDAMGHVRFLAFYLLCGIAAGIAHSLAEPFSVAPLIGASGSVAGVVAAYLMLHPRVKVWVLVLGRIPLRLTARWVLGLWVVTQFAMVFVQAGGEVAWWAHIGGLVTGAVLIIVMRRAGVPLFDRGLVVSAQPGRSRR